ALCRMLNSQFSRTQMPRQSVASAHFLIFTSGREMNLPFFAYAAVIKAVCVRTFLDFSFG
ncbi:MAG: hypothetical protein IJ121_07695, partial [Eubacterium sp.]|nr:hypothetical protein [Eubacterium sp.]